MPVLPSILAQLRHKRAETRILIQSWQRVPYGRERVLVAPPYGVPRFVCVVAWTRAVAPTQLLVLARPERPVRAGGLGNDLGCASNCSLCTSPRYKSRYALATKTLVERSSLNSRCTAAKKDEDGIMLASRSISSTM